VNCFCQYSYGNELNREADSDSSTEEKYEVFHKYWIWLGAEKDVDCSSYASVDKMHATCGVFSICELRDDHKGGRSNETDEETNI
jgi:hypothetical protein